ncbi:MAG: hypothetical protein ACREEM_12260 [Blastocatellia bacterium]
MDLMTGIEKESRREEPKTSMIKKTEELKTVTGAEEMIAVNNPVEVAPAIENCPVPVKSPQLQEKVNLIIHEWLTDMWLLTTGEEMHLDSVLDKRHNGRPLAIVCDGQMKLMESRPCTLDALRTVGIEMS